MLASAEVARQGPPILQMADAVLRANPLRRMSPAFGLVRRGDGRKDGQLVLPPVRTRSDDRTGGLRAEPLIAGVGEQGQARGEGQQLDQAGLADLGQVMDGARAGLPAEQQPPLGVGEDQRLDRVGPAFPETNRWRPARWAAGRRTRTSVASSRPTRPLALRWAITSARVRSRTPPSTVHPRSASSGHLPDRPG